MTFESRLRLARALGMIAHERGLPRVSAKDPRVMPLFRGMTPREGIRVIDAWYAGWDEARCLHEALDPKGREA